MFNVVTKVALKTDNTKQLQDSLKELAKKKVYVGIPQERNSERGEGIKQAELLYILTHGVRSREMISEMNESMGIGPNGYPFTEEFNKFSDNLSSGMPYSQAFALYLHSHGSPMWRIPPRPVLEPAIERNKQYIAKPLKQAVEAALNGEDPTPYLHKAGMLGQNFAREWFTDPENKWPPNAPATIKAKGSDKPMIDTGELRRSITYVIRG